jgi:hypothetical protein
MRAGADTSRNRTKLQAFHPSLRVFSIPVCILCAFTNWEVQRLVGPALCRSVHEHDSTGGAAPSTGQLHSYSTLNTLGAIIQTRPVEGTYEQPILLTVPVRPFFSELLGCRTDTFPLTGCCGTFRLVPYRYRARQTPFGTGSGLGGDKFRPGSCGPCGSPVCCVLPQAVPDFEREQSRRTPSFVSLWYPPTVDGDRPDADSQLSKMWTSSSAKGYSSGHGEPSALQVACDIRIFSHILEQPIVSRDI